MKDWSSNIWEEIGARDPYFGVFGNLKFQRTALNRQRLEAFFATGEAHVRWIQTVLERRFAVSGPYGRVLDYGCGVGRIAIPFSRVAGEVVGVDLAPAMIDEARRCAEMFHASNARFAPVGNMPEVCGEPFDIVHSYITFQHIPQREGMKIAGQLLRCLAPGGIGILHFTYQRNAGMSLRTRLSLELRRRAPRLSRRVRTMKSSRNLPAPMLCSYPLDEVMNLLYRDGVRECFVELTNLGLYAAVILFFRREAEPVTPAHLQAPQQIGVL